MLKKVKANQLFSLLIILLLISSCTSDLPEIQSEAIKESTFSISSLSGLNKVRINSPSTKKELRPFEIAQAKSLYKKVELKFLSGNLSVRPLINNIVINVPNDTADVINLKFKVSDNFLIAYTTSVKILDKNQYNNPSHLNLYQLPIQAFGVKRKQKNHLKEETRNIEFHQTARTDATHLRINTPFVDNVIIGGITGLEEKQQNKILRVSELENNVWIKRDILELIAQDNKLQRSSDSDLVHNLESQAKYSFRVSGAALYLQEIVTFNDLTEKEKKNLKLNISSSILHKCSKDFKEKQGFNDCYERSLYKAQISPIAITPKKDKNGVKLATIELDTEIETSTIIRLNSSKFSDVSMERNNFLFETKDRVILNKNEIDLESEYLYVPSTHNTPRNVVNASPFFQGEERLVRLKFKKEGLLVFEEDQDERFRENKQNQSPVLLIPGEHIDFNCEKKDKNGTCQELKKESRPWQERAFFAPNLNSFEHYQVNHIDLFNLNDSCIRNVSSRSKLTHYEISNGVINVEQEKTYIVNKNSSCMVELFYSDNMQGTSFTVKHFYSLVRLKDVASEGYQAMQYPEENHSVFGFFKNKHKKLGQDFTSSREKSSYHLKRFNPDLKEISYQLSENFKAPENDYIYNATKEVFNTINKSLKKANAKFEIKLEAPKKVYPGDIRKNSLVLITDPLANGILGYGPSVSNPRTGEIVQAHTNMYLGTLRKTTRRVYKYLEGMLREKPHSNNISKKEKTDQNKDFASFYEKEAQKRNLEKALERLRTSEETKKDLYTTHLNKQAANTKVAEKSELSQKDYLPVVKNHHHLHDHFDEHSESDFHRLDTEESFHEKTLKHYAKNNAFHEEALNFHTLGKVVIPEILNIASIVQENGALTPWEHLTKDQKESAIKIIITQAYKTTLAHEIGHNLGLRHNFQGSFDKDNFYHKDELPKESQHLSPKYSSIMDYGASQLNELPVLGKYDIAALRYGYSQQIELENGEMKSVKNGAILNTIKNKKAYMFCTDENAGASLECNRHDEGSSYKEIINFYISEYKNNYKELNFRDGREEFKSYELPYYIWRISRPLLKIREMISIFNSYENFYGINNLLGECTIPLQSVCQELKDVASATKMAGDFLINIILTPDKTCVIKFNEEIVNVKLSKVTASETSCYAPNVKKSLISGAEVIAEGGKFINDRKGNNESVKRYFDINVRGTWPDKLIAIKMLFGRTQLKGEDTGLSPISFLEHPLFEERLLNLIAHLTLDIPLQETIPFVNKKGEAISIPYSISNQTYIPARVTWYPTILFGFPLGAGADLNALILRSIAKENQSEEPGLKDLTQMIREKISVYKKPYISEDESKNTISFIEGTNRYIAGERNEFAHQMIEIIKFNDQLININPAFAGLILKERNSKRAPKGYTDEEKIIFSQTNLELIEHIQSFISSRPEPFSLKEINQLTGNPEISQFIFVAQSLGLERIEEIKADMQKPSLQKVPCLEVEGIEQFIGENEEEGCKTYDLLLRLPEEILYFKQNGMLGILSKKFKTKIKILPSFDSQEFNFIEQLY